MKKIVWRVLLITILVMCMALFVGCGSAVIDTNSPTNPTTTTDTAGDKDSDGDTDSGNGDDGDGAGDSGTDGDGTDGDRRPIHILESQHNYVRTVIEPTCTEWGEEIEECACGKGRRHTTDEPLGHDYTDFIEEDGWEKSTCNREGCNHVGLRTPIRYFTLQERSGNYEITGYTGTHKKVILPIAHNGKKIAGIMDNAFRNCTSIQSITFNHRLAHINIQAFNGCVNLVEVVDTTIEHRKNEINGQLNYALQILDQEAMMDNFITVGEYEYYNANDSYYMIAYNGTATELTLPSDFNGNSYALHYSAFINDTNITSVTIPNGVTKIADSAFMNCTELVSVQIPSSVNEIEVYTFFGCEKLQNVNFGADSQLKTLGRFAFNRCTSLQSLTLPDGLTTIEEYAFNECSNLQTLSIPNSITDVASEAFDGCSSLVYSIYDVAKYLGNNDNEHLVLVKADPDTTYNIHSDTKLICNLSFSNCDNIFTITIPNSVIKIGDEAFKDCASLQTVNISSNAVELGEEAFMNCWLIQTITIPASVKKIGANAFKDCNALTSVVFENPSYWLNVNTNTNSKRYIFNVDNSTTAATCLKQTYVDKVWEWTDVEHPHSYSTQVVAPTCTEGGYSNHVCICGESYQDNVTEKLGHDQVSHAAKSPTCAEVGWNAYVSCSRCEYSTYQEIEVVGHDMQFVSKGQPATCTEVGWETYFNCSRCEYTTYQEISALGHSLTHIDAQTADCWNDGWNAYDYCNNYGCEYNTYEKIPQLEHDWINHDAKAPTCTEIGWNAYQECSRCFSGDYYENKLSELGHDMGAYVPDGNATADEDGTETATCKREGCNHKLTQTDVDSRYEYVGFVFEFKNDEKGYYVTDERNLYQTGVYEIPSVYKDFPVIGIGERALAGKQIIKLSIPNSIKVIENNAFSKSMISTINIPSSVTTIGWGAFDCTGLQSINVEADNPNYCSEDGVLYNKDKTEILCYPSGKTETTFTISSGITKIEVAAFSMCENLQQVIFEQPSGWVMYDIYNPSNPMEVLGEFNEPYNAANSLRQAHMQYFVRNVN